MPDRYRIIKDGPSESEYGLYKLSATSARELVDYHTTKRAAETQLELLTGGKLMSKNRNKRARYKLAFAQPVTEVTLDVEDEDGDSEDVVEKAGARHSGADLTVLKGMRKKVGDFATDIAADLDAVGAPALEAAIEAAEEAIEAVETAAGVQETPAGEAAEAEKSNVDTAVGIVETAMGKGDGVEPAIPVSEANWFIPIEKVDVVKREVWGRGAQEIEDQARETMDYVTSKPLFMRWSEEAYKRSGGKSRGNLRAMHQAVAAGKLIQLQANDAEKAFDVGVKVVDDAEWAKVQEGVYTGFSVGGRYAKRWMDGAGKLRYTAEPHEISLVDAPCIPTATFQVIKEDGAIELRKFKVADKDPATKPGVVFSDAQKAEIKAAHGAGDTAQAQRLIIAALDTDGELKKAADLGALSDRIGIGFKPHFHGHSEGATFADPVNLAFPLDNADDARKALDAYNARENESMYEPHEWAVIGRRIARLAGAVMEEANYEYNPQTRAVVQKGAPSMTHAEVASKVSGLLPLIAAGGDKAADALTQAQSLLDVSVKKIEPEVEHPVASDAAKVPPASETQGEPPVAKADIPPEIQDKIDAKAEAADVKAEAKGDAKAKPAKVKKEGEEDTTMSDETEAKEAVAKSDGVFATNPPPVVMADGAGYVNAKLPEFMAALSAGRLRKAQDIADRDQQLFDEMFQKSLKLTMDEGKITYDEFAGGRVNKGVIFGAEGMGAGDEQVLRKGVSSSFAPGIYLQRLVKLMLPVVTPLRRRMFTKAADMGAQSAQWRAQLGYTNFIFAAAMSVAEAAVTLGSTTGVGQTLNESSLTFAAPFVSTPNNNVVSLQAVAAGRGFDDPLQIALIQSLTALLKTEELNILLGNSAAVAKPAAVTATGSGTGGTLPGTVTYTVKVTSLTGRGYRYTQELPSYVGGGTYTVGGVSFATAGESDNRAASGYAASGSTSSIAVSWAAVAGAAAYNVYIGNGTNEYYHSTVTKNSLTITAFPSAGNAAPTADTTANANGYEGVLPWCELSTVYSQAIPNKSFTDNAGAALTLSGANSITQFDTVLRNLWQNWNIAPSLILCSPQGALHQSAIIGSATNPPYRIEVQGSQGNLIGGTFVGGYTNKFAPYADGLPRQLDVMAHPYMPNGTYLFLTETINYPMAREARGWQIETRIPYTYFPLGPTAPNYPFTVLVDEALECFHPGAQAAIVGVNDA